MSWYTFRFDALHSKFHRHVLRTWVKGFSQGMIAEEHAEGTGKEHYQGLILADCNLETIRRNRPIPFDHLVKSEYSLSKVKDLDHYKSYLTKEKVILNHHVDMAGIEPWIKHEKKEKEGKRCYLAHVMSEYHKKYTPLQVLTVREISRFLLTQLKKDLKVFDYVIYERLLTGMLLQLEDYNSDIIENNFYLQYSRKCLFKEKGIAELSEEVESVGEFEEDEPEELIGK